MAEADVKLEFEAVFAPEHEIIIALEKALTVPSIPFAPSAITPENRPLVINIETTGFNPLKDKIIAIGYQDPLVPNGEPSVIMLEREQDMIAALFSIIQSFEYNELVGYGLSFDFRFLLVKAMKHGINCKEFYDMDLYDLMQGLAQGKFSFMYFPQRALKLSDVANFFWGYPKPFTDLEMLKYYASGDFSKVIEFTKSQIIRTVTLYSLFRGITESNFSGLGLGTTAIGSAQPIATTQSATSLLTIPEANKPDTWTAKCPNDLSEHKVPITTEEFICPIDGTVIKRP